MHNSSVRTQIIVPLKLRERIDVARRPLKESMAQYLRRAAEDRLEREQGQKVKLRLLANQVIGAGSLGFVRKQDVLVWQRQMRADRKNQYVSR